ncbi:hypothetical protein Cgig2_006447 [Carnegiea gigantea]|uniref:Peptidase A2 domain-containing protein n=1 Tax=Carnegiea gigantea TaxID=171969 RepID=A0A9Q1GJP2_9CARY|nr:hypothetical protein Cgig2_006447 [Carnegiea gigantea]
MLHRDSSNYCCRVTVPTIVFGWEKRPHFTSPYNDLLVVEMKVANAIVQRILIDTGSSEDIITWDCLKKLIYSGRDSVPLVHPILGFMGQEVNPNGMIRLPLSFRDKVRAKNLEVDFLVVDFLMAYNIILGRPTLHKVKVFIMIAGFGRPSSVAFEGLGLRPHHPGARFPHHPAPPRWRPDETPPIQDLDPRFELGARAPEKTRCPNRNPGNNLNPLPWWTSWPRLLLGSETPLASAPGLFFSASKGPFSFFRFLEGHLHLAIVSSHLWCSASRL